MTDLQKIEFDILKQVISICDSLGLMYYLVCGSALGAIKYNGFIPWDDDVDIALRREDYIVFLEKAGKLLPDNIFLQTFKTETVYPQIYCKIRNSDTTFIEKNVRYLDMNHGAYIDVFPLDGYPNNKIEQDNLNRKKRALQLKILCSYNLSNSVKFRTKVFVWVERILGFNKKTGKYLEELNDVLSYYSTKTSKVWCNHGNWQGKLEYAPKEQYGKGAWAIFEGLKVRVPEKYDEYLMQKYGDWRVDLPVAQQVGHHYAEVIDTVRPYTDYIVKLKNGRIRLKTATELLQEGITISEND